MEKAVIDLNALKLKYDFDSIPQHLWSIALDCKRRRDAFWRHSRKMKLYNNLLSIPLLILSSLTGLTSVAQLGVISYSEKVNEEGTTLTKTNGDSNNIAMPLVVTISGVSTAVLTAFQRYFRYAERSEHSKHMAKNYARIARRIENNMVLLESAAITIEPEMFKKFIEEIQKDVDSLMQEIDELPKELLNKRSFYKDFLDKIKKNESNINKNIEIVSTGTSIDTNTRLNINVTKKMAQASRQVCEENNVYTLKNNVVSAQEATIPESPKSFERNDSGLSNHS